MAIEGRPTNRGFMRYEFRDACDEECSLQESSLATEDCVWLGINHVQPLEDGYDPQWPARTRPMKPSPGCKMRAFGRMHLTREQVADLIPLLQHFVNTGDLPEGNASPIRSESEQDQ